MIEYDGCSAPDSLIILAEEEIVFIDLVSRGWPEWCAPYLMSLHASAITCLSHHSGLEQGVTETLGQMCSGHNGVTWSRREWPVQGGECDMLSGDTPGLIITGHEDGRVKLWQSQRNSLTLLSCLDTSRYFTTDEYNEDSDSVLGAEDWPPFRKVGVFDPFNDDPRYAIKTVDICPNTGLLVVGGMAGQLLVCSLDIKREFDIPLTDVDLMEEDEEFIWKGQDPLDVRSCQFRHPLGYRPLHILQLEPPSAITSLALNSDWNILAAGQKNSNPTLMISLTAQVKLLPTLIVNIVCILKFAKREHNLVKPKQIIILQTNTKLN